MSFGLTALKKRVPSDHGDHKRVHVQRLVLGHDLAAVLKLVELKREYGMENLRLITPRPLSREVLLETHRRSVSTLRDAAAADQVMGRFPQARVVQRTDESLFHKEGSWHRFGGRAKPMELMPGESFFLPPRHEISLPGLFPQDEWEKLDETLEALQQVRVLEQLEKTVPKDLERRDEWWLLFHDLGEVTCEELWLSLPSKDVLKATSGGKHLPPEAAAYFAGVKRQGAIALAWELTAPVHNEARTLFIPQSQTHEWGHFIIDVHPAEGNGPHLMTVMILMHEEEPTSEGMADKIKLCKRVLERVFPDFSRHAGTESILASEHHLEWPDEAADVEGLLIGVPKLHLLGSYGAGTLDANFLARALLTL